MKVFQKIINKIKNYHPKKYVCFLYFFIPLIIVAGSRMYICGDIWFLLKHGEYVINNGFPHTDFLSMHNNLHFVMQQWLSAVIFYVSFKCLGSIGLKLVLEIVNGIMLYFLYKLCMLLSKNKMRLSVAISIITDVLLLFFLMPRPWVFTFMNLVIVIYIMELFYQKENNKALIWLIPITIMQVNLQSSMWFLLIIFMLPYLADLLIKRQKRVWKLFLIIFLMIIASFINPYGVENVLYVYNSYNQPYVNITVAEMQPPKVSMDLENENIVGNTFFIFTITIVMIYILAKKGKICLRHFFLTIGTLFLALTNIRNISLFIIGSIPPLASYLSPYFKEIKISDLNIPTKLRKRYATIIIASIIYVIVIMCTISTSMPSKLKPGVDAMIKAGANNSDNIYANYNNGSYIEYRGLKPYIDARAEVFIKKNNHKADIIKEHFLLYFGRLDNEKFLKKYDFKYLLVDNDEFLLDNLTKSKDYKRIYKCKKYSVFERIN